MATYRKQLKDKDGNNIIPITHCVTAGDPTTLEEETPWITGSMINFSSFSGDGYIEIGDYLVQWGEKDFGNQTFTTDYWSMFNRSGNERMYITYPIEFSEPPIVMMKAAKTAIPFISIVPTANNNSTTRTHDFCMAVPKAYTDTAKVVIQWIAIGKK